MMRKLVAPLLLFLFLSMGLGVALADNPTIPHRVFGEVTYKDGSPAVGVSVRFLNDSGLEVASDVTNENGYYDFNIPEPEDKELEIFVGDWNSGKVLEWKRGKSEMINISGVPTPLPEVLTVSPTETSWDPDTTYKIKATVRDNNGLRDLDNVVVKAYASTLDNVAPDSERNHYTFWFDPSDNSWHSSLGDEFIESANCSQPEDLSARKGTYEFAINLAKTAKPTSWDLYSRAVDTRDKEGSLKNAEAMSVNVYTEFSLDRNTLNFSGAPGEMVTVDNSVVTVTTNEEFDVQVKLSGPWTTDDLSMPMDTTTANGTTLTDSYQSVWTGVEYGISVEKEIRWELSIPLYQEEGTYRTTFYVNVVH